ncbi:MAG: acyl-CoA synthetase [Gordonia polyisoprenivorans]|nr:acyl-CoA synthetase [Gordonia polyisoprenivorans]
MGADHRGFDLSTVFRTVARAVPERRITVWRGEVTTYEQMDARIDGIARHLVAVGLGCHTERPALQPWESGQDHLGIYLRNGTQYLESMVAAYRARVAPFNVSYRYVEDELLYLLDDAQATSLVYAAEFAPRVAAIRDRLPNLRVLIQVADDSGNDLLPGAVDYESKTRTVDPAPMPEPSGDDLYIIYTGGTTGMPKGVLWCQHDMFMSSMGGRPFGGGDPIASYDDLAQRARDSGGGLSVMLIAPLMHGAAQWATFSVITTGGWLAIPDDVVSFRPDEVLRLAERERVLNIPMVGDAIARPLVEELERTEYDLSGLMAVSNGGAALSPAVRERVLAALPGKMLFDAVGSSETGIQMNTFSTQDSETDTAVFTPQDDTTVVAADLDRMASPGDVGWLARRDLIPLGYLGDEAKTRRTYPTIDGVRWSVPGDRARLLDDGRIELMGRDSLTINSGGEKIFVEEVERAIAAHPAVYDVVVVGRPSERWGAEVVAIVQVADGAEVTDDELREGCSTQIARYKIPKVFLRTDKVQRSPVGKPDYRWAASVAVADTASAS